jgi:hypothetical protein
MSRQRKRHLDRQPIEETVRAAMSELVGDGGSVDVERHSYDWREDDLLVWVRLKSPVSGTVRELFRRRLAKGMDSLLPSGRPFEDWMVVAECGGETVFTIAWHERTDATDDEDHGASHFKVFPRPSASLAAG